jgi:hypothetical protein
LPVETADTPLSSNPPPVPGRSCGSCTACCKIFDLPELNSPVGKLCRHCKPGKGCTIWNDRPAVCRKFYCGYMFMPQMGDIWRPDKCGFVINIPPGKPNLMIIATGDIPFPWRKEPYFTGLKAISAIMFENNHNLIASNSLHSFVITPDGETKIGRIDELVDLQVLREETALGYRWRVEVQPHKAV